MIPYTCPECGSPCTGIIKVKHFNAPINYDPKTDEIAYNLFDSTILPGHIVEVFCTNEDCSWFHGHGTISVSHLGKEITDELPY